jgi:hypothetical protein
MSDELARTPHRMAQAHRQLLAGEARRAGCCKSRSKSQVIYRSYWRLLFVETKPTVIAFSSSLPSEG